MLIQGFKPNLIPNNPKDGSFSDSERDSIILKNGGYSEYIAFFKKDGCRLHFGIDNKILTRSLKEPNSNPLKKRFNDFNQLCLSKNIAVDAEFYMHNVKFNHIYKFFSNTDVTGEKYRLKLEKELKKNPEKFEVDYEGYDINFLTTFHKELKIHIFDGIILDRPDLKTFDQRWNEIINRLACPLSNNDFIEFQKPCLINSQEELNELYRVSLQQNYEGLVLTHRDHEYKYGRNSLKQGTLLKMKDDALEYDGVILNVEESTIVREGAEKTITELGRSRTSKKKEDRLPSGKAKGFRVEFEGLGTFTVGLRGFDDDAKKELWENRKSYIGRHFKYKGMKPVKDFPRHAYFDCWRDSK